MVQVELAVSAQACKFDFYPFLSSSYQSDSDNPQHLFFSWNYNQNPSLSTVLLRVRVTTAIPMPPRLSDSRQAAVVV